MCLRVDTKFHSNLHWISKNTDVHVLKVLSPDNSEFYTPIQRMRVNFRPFKANLVSYLDMPRQRYLTSYQSLEYIINRGIHALTTTSDPPCKGVEIFHAVIPANTRYYIGKDKDIVSERLIIFRYEWVYRLYRKTHKVTSKFNI